MAYTAKDGTTAITVPEGEVAFFVYYNSTAVRKYQPRLAWPLSSEINTVEKANAWLAEMYAAGTPVQYSYKMYSPHTYIISSAELFNALRGENVVWADTGPVSVDYWAND